MSGYVVIVEASKDTGVDDPFTTSAHGPFRSLDAAHAFRDRLQPRLDAWAAAEQAESDDGDPDDRLMGIPTAHARVLLLEAPTLRAALAWFQEP